MKPVNPIRYEIAYWKQLKVYKDIHVTFDYAYYSAPYEYKGEYLWCRGTKYKIQIFNHENEKIAEHKRVRKGKRQTNYDHYPPNKVKYMKYDTDYCKKKARLIGENTYRFIKSILDEEPIRNLRGAQNILWLSKKYPNYRIEKACCRALFFGNYTYYGIKNILEKGLDQQTFLFEEDNQPVKTLDDSYKRDFKLYFKEDDEWNHQDSLKLN
jgi:hypothetical protein